MDHRICLTILSALVMLRADDLIVPGVGVGPVTRTSTESSLRQALGRLAVKEDVDVGEGELEPGLVIYKNDPTRQLAVVWNDDKPAHPSAVFICYGSESSTCRWHTAGGIGFGTTLKELERRNGGPFEMTGWGFDNGGNITSYKNGSLEKELRGSGILWLTLYPQTDKQGQFVPKVTEEEYNAVQGDKFLQSSHPVFQKLNPRVAAMRLDFPRQINKR